MPADRIMPINMRRTCEVQFRHMRGLTLIELMLAMVISTIVLAAVGAAMLGGVHGYNSAYRRASTGVLSDGYVAARGFKATLRKSAMSSVRITDQGGALTARYYAALDSENLDRYARFYVSGNELRVEFGIVRPAQIVSTQTLCTNVSACTFAKVGNMVQMVLKIDDGQEESTVLSSAIPQN